MVYESMLVLLYICIGVISLNLTALFTVGTVWLICKMLPYISHVYSLFLLPPDHPELSEEEETLELK